MQYLLSRASQALLERLARERTLCAFDFDGTLSPIVEHPSLAGMREKTRNLLARLAALHPCVIVSGRSRADLLGKLKGVKVARVIGNHGAETEAAGRPPRLRVAQWKTSIELELAALPGVWVEDKGLSLATSLPPIASKSRSPPPDPRCNTEAQAGSCVRRQAGGERGGGRSTQQRRQLWPRNGIAWSATRSCTWVTTTMTRMPSPWTAISFRSESVESSGLTPVTTCGHRLRSTNSSDWLVLLRGPVKPCAG